MVVDFVDFGSKTRSVLPCTIRPALRFTRNLNFALSIFIWCTCTVVQAFERATARASTDKSNRIGTSYCLFVSR